MVSSSVLCLVMFTTTVNITRSLFLNPLRIPFRTQSVAKQSRSYFGSSALSYKKRTTPVEGQLEWDSFEFSDSPKWDARFENLGMMAATKNLKVMEEQETKQDVVARAELNNHQDAWESLDPELVERATQILIPYIQEERVERMRSVLMQRTKHTRLLFENPSNPSNIWVSR